MLKVTIEEQKGKKCGMDTATTGQVLEEVGHGKGNINSKKSRWLCFAVIFILTISTRKYLRF